MWGEFWTSHSVVRARVWALAAERTSASEGTSGGIGEVEREGAVEELAEVAALLRRLCDLLELRLDGAWGLSERYCDLAMDLVSERAE